MHAKAQLEAVNRVYRERDQLVAALSKHYEAHMSRHEGEWEDDWRWIVCIHLPTGQVTWHIHDSEIDLFGHLEWPAPNHWDGHDTEEKYRRLNALPASSGGRERLPVPGTSMHAEMSALVTHKEMNAKLAALCRELGIYCWINAGELHQYGTGWVDAVAIGSLGALFIENKTEDGRRTRAQISVSVLLTGAGLEYRLYRPVDYENDNVRIALYNIA